MHIPEHCDYWVTGGAIFEPDPYDGRYDDDCWSYPLMESVGFLVPGTNRVEEGTVFKAEMAAHAAVMDGKEANDFIVSNGDEQFTAYYSIAVKCETSGTIKVWSGISEHQILGRVVGEEQE